VWRRGTMYFRGLNIDLKRLIREGWIHNDSLSKQVITKSLCAGFLVVDRSQAMVHTYDSHFVITVGSDIALYAN
jgi:hypothetical protein